MMPEMSCNPPEDVQVGTCPVCGGEIYEGEICWATDGELICSWHLDAVMAAHLGYRRTEAC